MDAATIKGVIDRLTKRGLVEVSRDPVDRHEADIVPVARVFRTDIAETDEELHLMISKLKTRRPGFGRKRHMTVARL